MIDPVGKAGDDEGAAKRKKIIEEEGTKHIFAEGHVKPEQMGKKSVIAIEIHIEKLEVATLIKKNDDRAQGKGEKTEGEKHRGEHFDFHERTSGFCGILQRNKFSAFILLENPQLEKSSRITTIFKY